jgi:hypothetical protein
MSRQRLVLAKYKQSLKYNFYLRFLGRFEVVCAGGNFFIVLKASTFRNFADVYRPYPDKFG